jgi:hypothetical protein
MPSLGCVRVTDFSGSVLSWGVLAGVGSMLAGNPAGVELSVSAALVGALVIAVVLTALHALAPRIRQLPLVPESWPRATRFSARHRCSNWESSSSRWPASRCSTGSTGSPALRGKALHAPRLGPSGYT